MSFATAGKVLTVGVLASLALAPTVSGAGPEPIEMYVSKTPGGPSEQTITSKIKPGKSKLFYFLVFTSPPNDTRLIENKVDKPGKRYKVQWFRGEGDDGADITDKITKPNGTVFGNGGSQSYTAKVTRKKAGGDGYCMSLLGDVNGASQAAFVGLDGEFCTL